jgi:hypothetical protein
MIGRLPGHREAVWIYSVLYCRVIPPSKVRPLGLPTDFILFRMILILCFLDFSIRTQVLNIKVLKLLVVQQEDLLHMVIQAEKLAMQIMIVMCGLEEIIAS